MGFESHKILARVLLALSKMFWNFLALRLLIAAVKKIQLYTVPFQIKNYFELRIHLMKRKADGANSTQL